MRIRRPTRFINILSGLVLVVGLSACSSWPQAHTPQERSCDSEISPADKTRLTGIEQMIAEGKVYAALAQLEALRSSAPLVQLTRADALSKIDATDQAQELYGGLIASCHAGRAHHGLGLLLARRGNTDSSLQHLQNARAVLPTDPSIRNDLGYALLLAGRWQDARFELLTALDLDPQNVRAARNLILLTLRQGDTVKAQSQATQLGLDKAAMDKLVKQASELPQLNDTPTQPPASSGAAS